MKKTVTVSLNRNVFTLEEDAFHVLNGYLKRLEYHFSKDEGKQEILSDIEARIAEHLRENVKVDGQVINLEEVQRVINIMGDPGQIAGEEETKGTSDSKYRNYRHLYRDMDDRVLGGICAGMGSYWRIEPLLIRIIFVLITILGAFFVGIITYIVLWIVIPPALTTAQKLEMKGEPVTADNIGKSFNEYKK